MKVLISILLLALALPEVALSAPVAIKGTPAHPLTARGRAASEPPTQPDKPFQFARPTGNLHADLATINREAAAHRKEDMRLLNANIAKNHADARLNPQNAKADAKADGQWLGYVRADRKADEASRRQAIAAARQNDVRGGVQGIGKWGRG